MFHMAYLFASYIATKYSMDDPFRGQEGSQDVLLQLNLARGFTAWVDMIEGRRKLRNAAAKLTSPGLARGFTQWRGFVELVHAEAEASRLRNEQEASTKAANEAHEAELAALRDQLGRAASEAEAARLAHGLAVQQRKEQAMRRMMQLGLARALSSWRDMVRQRHVLRNAALGLRSPELASALRNWRRKAAEQRAKQEKTRI